MCEEFLMVLRAMWRRALVILMLDISAHCSRRFASVLLKVWLPWLRWIVGRALLALGEVFLLLIGPSCRSATVFGPRMDVSFVMAAVMVIDAVLMAGVLWLPIGRRVMRVRTPPTCPRLRGRGRGAFGGRVVRRQALVSGGMASGSCGCCRLALGLCEACCALLPPHGG